MRLGRARAFPPISKTAAVSPVTVGPNYPGSITVDASEGTTAWTGITIDATTGIMSEARIASGSTTSQYLYMDQFRFNIHQKRSIAGISATVRVKPGNVLPAEFTMQLIRNAVISSQKRRATLPATTEESGASVVFGGALDSWDEPWMPSEINALNFGITLRKENTDALSSFFIQYVRLTVYTTDLVLGHQSYAASSYNFGPTAIASGKTTISFYADTTTHTDSGVTLAMLIEVSYDSGSNWITATDTSMAGAAITGPSGIVEPRAWFRTGLADSGSSNRQYKGTLTISGGSLTTSVGAYLT